MSRLFALFVLLASGFILYWFSGKENQTILSYLAEDYLQTSDASGLLLGSSTLAYIDPDYLPSCLTWKNRAVGNSQLTHTQSYVRYTLPQKNISEIVMYVGENDIAYGLSPAEAFAAFEALFRQLSDKYSDADIYAILVKPSPARHVNWEGFREFNQRLLEMAREEPALTALDLVQQQPASGLFGADGIHLNARGYMKLHFELTKVCDD